MEMETLGKRIMIVGCPGSGKSTLARSLNKLTGLPLFHLDNVWWKPDRTHITRDEFDLKLDEIMQGGQWIIDGDYSRTYEVRFKNCDTVIFLDFSEEECMAGIRERVGSARPDIPWVEHDLDPELVKEVRKYHTENRPELYRLIDKYPDKKVLVFKTRSQITAWTENL